MKLKVILNYLKNINYISNRYLNLGLKVLVRMVIDQKIQVEQVGKIKAIQLVVMKLLGVMLMEQVLTEVLYYQ